MGRRREQPPGIGLPWGDAACLRCLRCLLLLPLRRRPASSQSSPRPRPPGAADGRDRADPDRRRHGGGELRRGGGLRGTGRSVPRRLPPLPRRPSDRKSSKNLVRTFVSDKLGYLTLHNSHVTTPPSAIARAEQAAKEKEVMQKTEVAPTASLASPARPSSQH